MKRKCFKCGHKAVWYYMPSLVNIDSDYFCEKHVNRKCLCQMEEDGSFPLDEEDRDLPCCEYDYSENGFDNDD